MTVPDVRIPAVRGRCTQPAVILGSWSGRHAGRLRFLGLYHSSIARRRRYDRVPGIGIGIGNAVAHDAPTAGTSGGALALTGAGSVVTYGMAGSIIAAAAGSVVVLRRRHGRAAYRR